MLLHGVNSHLEYSWGSKRKKSVFYNCNIDDLEDLFFTVMVLFKLSPRQGARNGNEITNPNYFKLSAVIESLSLARKKV